MSANPSPFEAFLNDGNINTALVEKMLEMNTRMSLEKGHDDEREELVCRLLANDMPIGEVSLILKIRIEEIVIIENNNIGKIIDYAKKLKTRRKYKQHMARQKQLQLK